MSGVKISPVSEKKGTMIDEHICLTIILFDTIESENVGIVPKILMYSHANQKHRKRDVFWRKKLQSWLCCSVSGFYDCIYGFFDKLGRVFLSSERFAVRNEIIEKNSENFSRTWNMLVSVFMCALYRLQLSSCRQENRIHAVFQWYYDSISLLRVWPVNFWVSG